MKLWLLIVLLAVMCKAQDYSVIPVPANFKVDANTTFFVSLTNAKTQADFAIGNSALTLDTNNFTVDSGYTGAIGFETAANFTTNAWTIEMLIKVSYLDAMASISNGGGD